MTAEEDRLAQAKRIEELAKSGEDDGTTNEAARSADLDASIDAVARMGGRGTVSSQLEAKREAISLIVQARIAQRTVEAMTKLEVELGRLTSTTERLERGATKLQWTAIGVAVVLGVLQLWLAGLDAHSASRTPEAPLPEASASGIATESPEARAETFSSCIAAGELDCNTVFHRWADEGKSRPSTASSVSGMAVEAKRFVEGLEARNERCLAAIMADCASRRELAP